MKTPAEAAFAAYYDISTPPFRQNDSGPGSAWFIVAKAAIEAHLATVEEGLPTRFEIIEVLSSTSVFSLADIRVLRQLFTERFAKLQAERDELTFNLNQSIAFGQKAETALANARHTHANALENVALLSAENAELRAMNQKASEAFNQANLTERSLRHELAVVTAERDKAIADFNSIVRKGCLGWYDDQYAMIKNLHLRVSERDAAIAELNARLIDRTNESLRKLEEKTKRERYVPIDEHEAKMKVAVQAFQSLVNCEDRLRFPEVREDLDGMKLASFAKEALIKLKGTK